MIKAVQTKSASVPTGLGRKMLKRMVYGASIGIETTKVDELIDIIKVGLPITAFEALQHKLDIPASDLAEVISIPVRTLTRRKATGRLDQNESERLFRVAKVFDKASDVLGDATRAQAWCLSPCRALSNKTPLEYAGSELGAQEVFDLLGRLEHGVLA